jgi:hypothetical protein
MKAHVPTKETRTVVERGIALLDGEEKVASLLGITRPTLRKHYRQDLDRGLAVAVAHVGGAVLKAAMEGNMQAAALFLKCRGGWRDINTVVEVTEPKQVVFAISTVDALL